MAIQETARIAAEWWAEVLKEEPAKMQGSTLADVYRVANPTPAQLTTFVHSLRGLIEKAHRTSHGNADVCLNVDYWPDTILGFALEDAAYTEAATGNSYGRLPVKTTMWVSDESVHVSVGRGTPMVCIYPPTPDHVPTQKQAHPGGA